ncbi:MAG: DUF4258 domain-containing protein [Candidatus Ozemobacteraceae bacterium]
MHQKVLLVFREKIRLREYVMTLHALEEMEDDGFSVFDVERAILTGSIVEKQKDLVTGENKYLVRGQRIKGKFMITVGKIGATDKLVIITVYR